MVSPGEYMVGLSAESGEIILTGGGKQYRLPATRRRTQSKSKITSVTFYGGGGNVMSLIISTPKQGEWISMLEYQKDNRRHRG